MRKYIVILFYKDILRAKTQNENKLRILRIEKD